MVAMYILNE